MSVAREESGVSFVLSATLYQCVTYFAFGLMASAIFRYDALFSLPVIGDYYRPYGSAASLVGPASQLLRGALFGLVLLPLREFLRGERLGWLWLWMLFLVIGIVGTPSASPGSIEGAIYTRLPLWFHLIGLPEIGLQTLAFSLLVHRRLRSREHPLPAAATRAIRCLAASCISFIGYTVVSVAFALLSGVKVDQADASPAVLGQFLAPLALTFVAALMDRIDNKLRHALLYAASAGSIWLYQELVLGSGGWFYSLLAPLLPVAISFLLAMRAEAAKARDNRRRDQP